jgi:excisionase family DNA binding protein
MTKTQRSTDAAETPLPPLTVAECCELARVCRRTIVRWVDERRFESWRPIARGSGRRLIDRASFLAFLGRSDEAAA